MSEAIVADIRRIAQEEGVDPDLAVRVAKQESGFRQDATSRAGARGIMQLMPDTAKELGVDLNDPMQNIRGGVRYLGQQQRAFGSPDLALAAYNAGPGRVREYLRTGRALPQETNNYVSALRGAGISPDIASVDYTDASGNIIVSGGERRRQLQPGEELLSAEVRPTVLSERLLSGLPDPMKEGLVEREKIRDQISGGEREIARLMGEKQQALATGEREAREKGVLDQEAAIARYQQQRQMPKTFEPTQETAGDLSALFGLLGVFGTLLGGGGKQNALAAMNAMTGMMQGWRQGRQDLYNREKQVFETNMKQLEVRNTELRRDMQSALDLAKTNMDAALAKVREIGTRYDMPILLAQANNNNLKGAMDIVGEANRLQEKLLDRQLRLDDEQRRRVANVQDQIDRERRANAAAAGIGIETIIRGQSPEDQRVTRELIGAARVDAQTSRRIPAAYAMLDTTEKVARSVRENPDAVGVIAAAMANRGIEPAASFFDSVAQQFRQFNGTNDPDGTRAAAALAQAQARGAQLEAQFGARFEEMVRNPDNFRRTLTLADYNALKALNEEQRLDLISRTRVMAKDLFSLALEDAVGTGRPTVFLERSLSNLYGQANRPETLLGILKSRASQAQISLRNASPQFDPEKQTNFDTRFSLLRLTPTEFMRQGQRPRGSSAAPPAATETAPTQTTVQPSQNAIEFLRANPTPQRRTQFDDIYGAGAAARILGGE